MQTYRFQGINRFGKRVRGEMLASNEKDLERRLRNTHIELLTAKVKTNAWWQSLSRSRVTRRDVIVMTNQFRQLLKAGVSLMEIIDDLRRTYENDQVREMLTVIYESMEGGETFSSALRPYENTFGRVYLSLVAVGERTGQLENVLEKLESALQWEESLASKAKKVMIYPSIVGLVVLSVVMLMMLFVVPELLTFIQQMGGELGFATASLIATSEFIQNNILILLAMPFVITALVKAWLKRSQQFRLWYDRHLFKLPLIGGVLYKIKVARLAGTLAVMYASGVNFRDSLALSGEVTSNAYMEQTVHNAIRLIEEGEMIYRAFEESDIFPAMAIRMVRIGEQSGNMDDALHHVSEYYDNAAKEMIEKIEPAVEPILTVVMAVIVGWVMMAVLGPVYDTISQVQ
ncbi:MAG: type II secretion system F family protein [Hydrogenovibrio sp.]|uniref:type II secretion system F family protein n=1 Tax=Hydrogenovibrio sp. TaxID=2065821 RepID=UPI0028704F16|nr:type II secretion system F family protein [Hydrogenovibrio sp.]MDR9498097.1 type II secretion system F family protein [Hydrogenovibrio sp.]